jgi:hypothetical protein
MLPACFRSLLFCLLILPFKQIAAQNGLTTCPNLKEGTFYSYPLNSNDNWKSIRNGTIQEEINLTTGDTLYFDVTWTGDCLYTLKYKSGGKKLDRQALAIFKQYSFVNVIQHTAPGYYVTTSYLDAATNYPISIDTLWHSEQKPSSDRIVFTALNAAGQRKAKLKDTSSFALLYVYRPSKFICSAVSFPMYGNDLLMCGFPEKGGAFVFKIQKQGPLRLQGQHRQKKDYLDLDIRFGQKYYVRVDTKWSMSRCIPYLTEKEKEKGEEEFLEAQF